MNVQTHTPPAYVEQKKKDTERKNSSGPVLVAKKAIVNGSTATSSAAASPKPPKLKEAKETYPAPPPLPGSGLMQLGGGANTGMSFFFTAQSSRHDFLHKNPTNQIFRYRIQSPNSRS